MRIQADCLAANPPYGCDAHVKPIVLKHIETWCASYRQHTLPHRRADQAQRIRQRRAASRSKPPKTATGVKLAVVRIQTDCLAANPPYGCDAHVKPIVLKHIETWCASYRQHTLPHRRADQAQRIRQRRAASRSRQKPPPG
ncbi:hypothetical protein Q9L42_012440 [Methylomarinum sp. Ch1-1]|uniref:Uncharacterized protein n=1 Tax=Methylomarinum roseum TaxID=3067653 RepID=A0AAU7NQC5_9GAMM|nr:hypothetical protein [Methylomarinum sp. Ch1-1]MDP4520879.1 hypothetical protein [Methylomarinum sp. Ch1-1]